MVSNLIDQLKRDEGELLHVYLDSKGIRTAGVGHNLEAHGIDLPVGTPITQDQSDSWLEQDVEAACNLLSSNASWTDQLDDARLGALQNMTFNMGWGDGKHGLSSFTGFLGLVKSGNYAAAADDEIHTLWAREVGPRAVRLSQQMRTGQWV